jgi:hypothetical protein
MDDTTVREGGKGASEQLEYGDLDSFEIFA